MHVVECASVALMDIVVGLERPTVVDRAAV